MNFIKENKLQYFVLITNKNKKNKFLSLLLDNGAYEVETVYAHGSINSNAISTAFGLTEIENKVIITCLLKYNNSKKLIDILYSEYKFNKPNTGIAYSISVEGLAF
jgi:hypothetical protein